MTTRIVLIEDDPDIAQLVEAVLTDRGHQVDLRAGLDGPIDRETRLVITDLITLRSYDVQSARTWVARVRTAFPEAAVIVSSAHGAVAEVGARAIGADAVLTKPFDIDEFTETVETLLGA